MMDNHSLLLSQHRCSSICYECYKQYDDDYSAPVEDWSNVHFRDLWIIVIIFDLRHVMYNWL